MDNSLPSGLPWAYLAATMFFHSSLAINVSQSLLADRDNTVSRSSPQEEDFDATLVPTAPSTPAIIPPSGPPSPRSPPISYILCRCGAIIFTTRLASTPTTNHVHSILGTTPKWYCGSCILPTVKSPYSPTFQTSPLLSIHSESTILNSVVQIWKSKSESKQTGLEAPILPSPLVGLFFLIPEWHSTQSRLLCRFPRVSTTLVTLFISSMVSFWPLPFSLSQHFLIRLSPEYPPWTIKFMYYR